MSTRCNMVVKRGEEQQQIYRHCDGYPESIIPALREAFEMAKGGFGAARVGKSAGLICAQNPGGCEPEGPGFHGDIEYLYFVDLSKSTDARPRWTVEARETTEAFWDDPTLANTHAIQRADIMDLEAWKEFENPPGA